ncbi:VCBS repeat-containing protein [Salipiger sp. P9]|uniref:VCBS repeat-containing protein n=1 Tax=Salipiger pentaromativorans TaxID=2943193 RepID=UPI002157423C|nr:VCBS repeat-containing protein [Salipiger pentaromativorans]MCR8546555.1 VCBS repeat-containing protein [Salipiger pentaromativorans]
MRRWRRTARGAVAALGLWLTLPGAAEAAPRLIAAEYLEPTTRYDHGVLGDAVEWGALRLRIEDCAGCGKRDVVIRLPQERVFEDVAPRLVDLGGRDAVMVVESDLARGARLALYTETGLLAAAPFIGQRNRWLAPVGAGDLDGDGRIELAYVDRPHLAKLLRVWRYVPGSRELRAVAQRAGLTNHRIGWGYIEGGLRDCGAGPEMITADAVWGRVMASRLHAGRIETRALGLYGAGAMRAAMDCR